MANNLEQIIVEYKLDITTLQQQVQQVKTSFTDLQSTGKTSIDTLNGSFEKLRAEISQVTNTKMFDGALKDCEELIKKLQGLNREQVNLNNGLKTVQLSLEGMKDIATAFDSTLKAAENLNAKNKDVESSLGNVTKAVGIVKQAVEAYGTELKVVKALEEAFAVESVAAWAAATAGLTALIAAIALAISYMNDLTDAAKKQHEAEKKLQEVRDKAVTSTEEERVKVQGLIKEYAQANTTQKRRKEIIGELNDISSTYFGQLDKEKTKIDDLEKSYKKWAQALILKAKIENDAKQIAESNNKLLESKRKFENGDISGWNSAKANILSHFTFMSEEELKAEYGRDEYLEAIKGNKQTVDGLTADMIANQKELDELGGDPTKNRATAKIITGKNTSDKEQPPVIVEVNVVTNGTREPVPVDEKIESRLFDNGPDTMQKLPEEKRTLTDAEKWGLVLKDFENTWPTKMRDLSTKISGIVSDIFKGQMQSIENQLKASENALNKWHTHALDVAGTNATKRAAIDKLYAKQQEKLQHDAAIKEAKVKRKQAEMDKAMRLFNIVIKTAENINSYVGGLPYTAPLLAMAAAMGAAEIAVVSAQPLPDIPKFARGIVGYKGKGTYTSDSNLVAISNMESIIAAKPTLKYGEELEAINNMKFEQLLLNKYLLPALQSSSKTGTGYDDWLLRKDVREGNHTVRKSAEYIVQGVADAVKHNSYFNTRYHA